MVSGVSRISLVTRAAAEFVSFRSAISIQWLTRSAFSLSRCTVLRSWWRTANTARSMWRTKFLNTRRARTRRTPRVRAAIKPSRLVSADKPSPSSERRPSRPRRSPWSSRASIRKNHTPESSVGARRSSSVRTRRRTGLAPSSESSNASGKAPRFLRLDHPLRETSKLEMVASLVPIKFFSQRFSFFFII